MSTVLRVHDIDFLKRTADFTKSLPVDLTLGLIQETKLVQKPWYERYVYLIEELTWSLIMTTSGLDVLTDFNEWASTNTPHA